MREIKFRFWDDQNKRFWHGGQEGESEGRETFQTYFEDGCLVAIMYEPISYGFKSVDDFDERKLTPSQYTGLKDKHDKEIYEGDILKLHGVSTFGNKDVVEIVFQDGCFLQYDGKYKEYIYDKSYIEITGSIYDGKS